jgi:hypothetical protein
VEAQCEAEGYHFTLAVRNLEDEKQWVGKKAVIWEKRPCDIMHHNLFPVICSRQGLLANQADEDSFA